MPSSKAQLRKQMLALRKAMPSEERKAADASINSKILALPGFNKAELVAAYLSDGAEPDLEACLKEVFKSGRRVCLPKSQGGRYFLAEVKSLKEGIREGLYGLKEPDGKAPEVSVNELRTAIWLVPGVAFDEKGGRLGRGKGVYDRLLSGGCGLAIGIFYEFQKCDSLPTEGHDFALDMIVTEREVRELSLKKEGKVD